MSKINLDDWWQDKEAKSISYFSKKDFVKFDKELIKELKKVSRLNDNANARFCLHRSTEETLHDMIILEYKDKTCRKPHKHPLKNETLHIIEGELDVFLFEENGELIYRTNLSPGENFAFRAAKNQYHLWLPTKKSVMYRELKQGPFQQGDNILARWDHIPLVRGLIGKNIDCFNPKCDSPCKLNKILL